MPIQVIRVMTRANIHLLAESGHPHRDIATRMKVGERSVRRVLAEPCPTVEPWRWTIEPLAATGIGPTATFGVLREKEPTLHGAVCCEAARRADDYGSRTARKGCGDPRDHQGRRVDQADFGYAGPRPICV